jgi:uncharacterized membrane protein
MLKLTAVSSTTANSAASSQNRRKHRRNTLMKTIALSLLVLGLLSVQVSEASAAACAAGPHRAGCVGPRGAVGVHRGYGYRGAAVVRPRYGYGAHCYWRGGVHICR